MTHPIEKARQLGKEQAQSAASWVCDGNSSQEGIVQILALIEDGDPAVDEFLPRRPNLSGEYAGEMTPQKLAEEVGIRDSSDLYDEICEAYEQGVDEEFEAACERQLSKFIK